MSSDLARAFASCSTRSVVAPAGCGKTHLIAAAMPHCTGPQLVLTHTHAGVRAILDKLKREGVPSSACTVRTIDGLALRYATAFPTLSGCTQAQPSGDDWECIRQAAVAALGHRAVRRVISTSYSGLIVDEYQDCTRSQHELITRLAGIVPCRVLGDPMQSLFASIGKDGHPCWIEDVLATFPVLDEMMKAWRWLASNPALGTWLHTIRTPLEEGRPIDLKTAHLAWQSAVSEQDQVSACYRALGRNNGTVLALRQWRPQCYRLARFLRNTYSCIEPVEFDDLMSWAARLETVTGSRLAVEFTRFCEECWAALPGPIRNVFAAIRGATGCRPRQQDAKRVRDAIEWLRHGDDALRLAEAMDRVESCWRGATLARWELWNLMKRASAEHKAAPCKSLRGIAWHLRDTERTVGRRVPRRCLGTPLLVKGLEFHHAVVLDARDFKDAESLYVALTRASTSLTVLSPTGSLQLPPPRYMRRCASDGCSGATGDASSSQR